MKLYITYPDESRGEVEIKPELCPKCGNDKHYYMSGIGYWEVICASCGYQMVDATDPEYEG